MQDLLGTDFVLRPAVPLTVAEAALEEMEAYLQGGALPQTEAVREFLENLAIEALLGLAGPTGRERLRAMTLFATPVPHHVLAAFAAVGGDPRRLRDLGLLVPAEDLVTTGVVALSVNGLAASRRKPLSEGRKGQACGNVRLERYSRLSQGAIRPIPFRLRHDWLVCCGKSWRAS